MISVNTNSSPGGNVIVKATTCCSECGSVTILSDYLGTYWNCGGHYFSMSPNPADDYVEISINKNKLAENAIDYYQVKIYNSLKVAVYETGKTKEPVLRVNTTQFQNGIYFIHITAGKQSEVKQLVVSH